MKHIGIVVSAGVGSRIGGSVPKQYLELCGKPVLFYSLKAMQDSFLDEIVLVVAKEYCDYCKTDIIEKYGLSKVKHVVIGGKERWNSVCNGLNTVSEPENSYVYIHDAARPMLSLEILERNREAVEKHLAVVTAVNSKDTVKVVDESGKVEYTPNRKNVWNVQTPQVFRADLLLEAYNNMISKDEGNVTDDGMVMELYGSQNVYICEGDYSNIKITTQEDFSVAEKFLQKFQKFS